MASTTLIKSLLHNSIAESVYKEISSKSGRYYYFLGTVLDTQDSDPVDSFEYERAVRDNIILVKEIQSSDVAFVVPRINWSPNVVYDIYDDLYCDQIIGIDLKAGGTNYSAGTSVTITGGGGVGANANVVLNGGVITGVIMSTRGSGYNTEPTVTFTDSTGAGASGNAILNLSYSGAKELSAAKFYVVTDDFNIYKCLNNNKNGLSTSKPTEVGPSPFTTQDGYTWKYLGSVPAGMRNKFLSANNLPLITALNSQFYSSGEIKTVNIVNSGNNYTSANVLVSGDGYSESDPLVLTGISVINQGNLYTSASITIEPPLTPTANWAGSNVYGVGQILRHNTNFYEVIQSGTTASSGLPPVHTKGVALNGNVILKYRGTGITANANIVGQKIDKLNNLTAMVRDIIITRGGSGYISPPTITITGTGTGATAASTLFNNTVGSITVTQSGQGFTAIPSVVVGTPWSSGMNVYLNTQVFNNDKLYTVTVGGYGNTTAPTHTTGTYILGNASFTFAGVNATANARIKYGSGYSKRPNIIITSASGSNANIIFTTEKSEATLYPFIEGGKITRIIIADGGIGYSYANVNIVGDGQNAVARAFFLTNDLTTPQAISEILTVPGAIYSIKPVSKGYGYTTANAIITGDGTDATANVTLVAGRVDSINIISSGINYSHANVIITGNGNGATARAILAPIGGHGKDVVKELFARSLAFYSTLGQDSNQGYIVNNDYRQFGIIKNIKDYSNDKFFSGSVGTGGWVLSGSVDITKFTKDKIITRGSDGAQFLIVSSTTGGLLVVDLTGKAPAINDILSEPSGGLVNVTGVTKPDVNKYTGDILFIDNRRALAAAADQTITFKTVFNY